MTDRNTKIRASQIRNDDLLPEDLASTNELGSGVDNYVPSYDSATGKFTWVAQGGISNLGYETSFTNANLSNGILTVNHNLSNKYNIVQIYDNNDQLILADNVNCIDTNQLKVYLTSYGTISGTWRVVVINPNAS